MKIPDSILSKMRIAVGGAGLALALTGCAPVQSSDAAPAPTPATTPPTIQDKPAATTVYKPTPAVQPTATPKTVADPNLREPKQVTPKFSPDYCPPCGRG